MKVLHVFHHYRPCIGGVEKVILELNKGLSKKGHGCSVLCLNKCSKGAGMMPSKQNFPEAKVERLGFLDLGFYKFAPFGLGRLAEVDVVHVHGLGFFFDFLALTKWLHRKPIVLSTHGGIFHRKERRLLKRLYFDFLARALMGQVDKVVAVSKNDNKIFDRIVDKEKMIVIENGIDFGSLGKLKRKPKKNSFLFVGRLSQTKGLHELLDAFALVKRKLPGFSLKVVGKEFDVSKEELEGKAAELGISENVKFLGMVSDAELKKAYSEAEFFASASRFEGFGITALEAMASGLVPLLNDIPSFRDFTKNGENGFVVDFGKAGKAAETIVRAMKASPAKKEKLVRNARNFARKFDWKEKADLYENVYVQCAGVKA
jgi:alpha-1,3-mannosyltransferase